MSIEQLEPRALWTNFARLNAVPRGSKKEHRAVALVEQFGRELGLETVTDAAGNVLLKKQATQGKQDRPVVALQGHLDMVHQKNASTRFDFDTEGIRMIVDGDWVRADGTTLGADNGVGVAAIMAVLASEGLSHPPLEALFTVDEETGMTGAREFEGGLLRARYLLNLDTEDDRELTIGCAGGVDILGTGSCPTTALPADHQLGTVVVDGLTGGHSGTDIHLGRANANKLLNRFLLNATSSLQLKLCSIDGGGLRNAIPREARAVVAVPQVHADRLARLLSQTQSCYAQEYRVTDPGLRLSWKPGDSVAGKVLEQSFQNRFLRAVYAIPNGIYRLSPDVPGLVQTSNNLARVLLENGGYDVQALSRSSLDSERTDVATAVASAMELADARVRLTGDYPGWAPRPDSEIVELISSVYRELFHLEPHVNACHAGLECGILGQNYPDMEMVSFGPNIRGAHSPDEAVQVSSVQKFWQLLTTTLDRI